MARNARIVNGYRLIYLSDHPTSYKGSENWEGYVYEHRYVVEKRLGRSLSKDELVHHLDSNRLNNRSENLIVLSEEDHGRLHAWIDKGAFTFESGDGNRMNSKEANPEISYCKICENTLQGKQKYTCSSKCHFLSVRKVSERPNYNQLMEDLNSMSVVAVGRKYGVSDNAIRKWIKQYERGMLTLSEAFGTPEERAETIGEVETS